MTMDQSKRKVAVLGATGAVGQRFVQLLSGHPWFKVEVLAASERSAGKKYVDAARWILDSEMPEEVKKMIVVETDLDSVEAAGDIDLVFSSLPANLAGAIEEIYAEKYPVFSKASAHRMEEDVPLLIPEVNPEHLALIPLQKRRRGWKGFISTDPNCSTIQAAITLKPLMTFGLKRVLISTMQALSGAGYPGVASLDTIDNVIPYISNEEEKMESETLKILGSFKNGSIQRADIKVSASCNRVSVKDGHLESIFAELSEEVNTSEVKETLESFEGVPQQLNLPSAPEHPIIVRDELDRPQPRFDRYAGGGMSVVVGRIRRDPVLSVKYMCLGHNTIRGAAGAAILSAELAVKRGYA